MASSTAFGGDVAVHMAAGEAKRGSGAINGISTVVYKAQLIYSVYKL